MNIKKQIILFILLFFLILLFVKQSFALEKTVLNFSYPSGPCNNQLYNTFSSIFDSIVIDSCSIEVSSVDVTSIVKLDLSNRELSSVSTGDNIFKYFINLKELDLSNNNISSINPIANSGVQLEKLNVSNNSLSDSKETMNSPIIYNLLRKIPSLVELDLSNNKLKYIKANSIHGLKKLNMYNNEIQDLDGLRYLNSLEYLNIGDNYTDDVMNNMDALNALTNLKFFDFSENKVSTILEYVTNMTSLEELNVEQNKISNINSNIANLSNLKSLNMYKNRLSSVDNLVLLKDTLECLIVQENLLNNVDVFLQMVNLKKLDIAYNSQIGDAYDNNNNNSLSLKQLINVFNDDEKELNYEYITDPTSLVGKNYVSYEDFGARCDGVFDDFIAIRNAHMYANEKNVDIKAVANNKCKNGDYHIFKYYEKNVIVKTNVDWNNATYIIHDENINYKSGKYKSIFKITNIEENIVFSNPELIINKTTKNINSFVQSNLVNLNNKGYTEYLFVVKNSNKLQYIRTGSNADSGIEQKEFILVNSSGDILSEIHNDFAEITSLEVYAIPNREITIKNANFVINSIDSHGENINGKESYFDRNILLENVSNVTISNISHSLSVDDISGNYSGFLSFHYAMHINADDLYLHAYKRQYNSSYALNLNGVVDATFHGVQTNPNNDSIYDQTRFGIIGANYIKDIVFDECVMNRIDTHKSAHNITVTNSTIGYGSISIIGSGFLDVKNTSVNSNTFINLRSDFGGTFDGIVKIENSTFIYNGKGVPSLINGSVYYENNKSVHQYGYDCKLPRLDVINMHFDLNNFESNDIYLYNISKLYDYNNSDMEYKENSINFLEIYLPTSVKLHGYDISDGNANIMLFDDNTNNYLNDLNSWSLSLFEIEESSQYIVTFDSNGGSNVPSQTVNYNGKATNPSNPTKTGYIFVKWQLNGNDYDFDTPITGNITLTAVWNQSLKNILESKKYVVYSNYVTKFTIGNAVSSIRTQLGSDVTIETDKTFIATGAVIRKGSESYTTVVKGDLNGDGSVNSGDLLQMRWHLIDDVVLEGAYKEAGIIESNGNIKSLDLLRLRQYLLDEYEFN